MNNIDDIISPERLHITVSGSGAGAIKFYATGTRNSSLRSVLIGEALHPGIGPLDTLTDPEARIAWVKSQPHDLHGILWPDDSSCDDTVNRMTDFWNTIQYWKGAATCWHSSRNAMDASFVLALIKFADRSLEFDFVDVAMLQTRPFRHVSVGECKPEDIDSALPLATRIKPEELLELSYKYNALSAERAPSRRFRNGALVNQSLDEIDAIILEQTSTRWRPLADVVALIMNSKTDDGYFDTDYYTLVWRLRFLVFENKIERRGESSRTLYDDNPFEGDVRRVS